MFTIAILTTISMAIVFLFGYQSNQNKKPGPERSQPTLTIKVTPTSDLIDNKKHFLSEEEIKSIALETLERERDVQVGSLELESYSQVDWRDSSLGCPEPGRFYAQAIVPGYRVVVSLDGREYEIHLGIPNQRGVICD
jgi:hypothetical protein